MNKKAFFFSIELLAAENGTEYDFGIAGAVPWRQFPGDAFSNTSRRRHETMQDHRPQAAF